MLTHQKRIRASVSGQTSLIGADIASHKHLTKRLLDDAGVPVPRGVLVSSIDDALREAGRLGFPLVTKPLDGNHGRGITTGIANEEQLRFGFDLAREHGRRVVVEQFFPGRDHRILVVGGKLVAVAERRPERPIGKRSWCKRSSFWLRMFVTKRICCYPDYKRLFCPCS